MIGDTPMLIVYGQDITERTRLERERQEWQEQTFHWQRLESIGRLAGGIAHDFNNFLHAMQGHLDIIRYMHPVEDPDVNRHLDVIDSITEKAATLTKQLLGFARKGNYNESDIELETFIRSAVDLFMPASSAIPVNVDVNILAEKKLIIRGDPIQLQQALMNIMFNARDAMENVPEAKRKLIISLYEHDDSNTTDLRPPPEIADWKEYHYCVIRVLDSGTGIGDDAINRLFEPFFTTKPVGKGTGMGLSMAYGILLAHKGWIQAENAPEGGAAFSFFLRIPDQSTCDESTNT
jgi:C4-dicarboxylate-specific signal transduction histidine kinase